MTARCWRWGVLVVCTACGAAVAETEQPRSGTSGRDVLLGGARSDRLLGLGGDELLRGGGGSDELRGGAGADRLEGGDGDDVLRGGPGADLLQGGSGVDVLIGGPGADRFIVHAENAGKRPDLARDFRLQEGDRVEIVMPAGANAKEVRERVELRKGVLRLRWTGGRVLQLLQLGNVGASVGELLDRRQIIIRVPLR